MDAADFLRIIAAFITVIGLIGVSALAAKKIGLAGTGGAGGRKRRLALVETLPLDPKRRLAIVKCDGKEHLVVLSATGETIIDRDIPAAPDDIGEDAPTDMGAQNASALNPFSAFVAARARQDDADAA
ncbi:MAG: flagellar biosynthetic protein FliO [Pseudomonadota bacterium]